MTTEDKSRRQVIDEAQGKFEQAGTQMAADKARVLRLQAELLQASERSHKSVQAYADAEVALAQALTGDPVFAPAADQPAEGGGQVENKIDPMPNGGFTVRPIPSDLSQLDV